jgi:hypothetical protein
MSCIVQCIAVDVFMMNRKDLVVSGQNPAHPIQSDLCPRLWRSQEPRRFKRPPVWLLKLGQKICFAEVLGRALLLPSRVTKVKSQRCILKRKVGRVIETFCETTVCYSKIKRILGNRKERSVTVQRKGCELDDQEIGVWFSAVAISSFPQHPHHLLETFSVVALNSFPGRVAISS